jgi:hypothetical protein
VSGLPRFLSVVTATAVVTAGIVAGCSGFTPVGSDAPASLAVNPRTSHVNVGESIQLHVAGASGGVSWSSSDPSVASVTFGRVTGVGSGNVTIHAVSGAAVANAIVSVTRAAAIGFSTNNLTFDDAPSAPLPDSQIVDITNAGEDPLTGLSISGITYTGGGASDWLTARLTATDAPAKLIIRPSTSTLATGSYTATIAITSSAASAGTQIVAVRFNIVRPAAIALAANSASFTVQQGSATPAQQSVAITNGGDAPLTGLSVGTITYSAGATGWLDASLTAADAPSSLLIQPNSSALAPGDYSATVPIASSIPGVTPASLTVNYHVDPAPTAATIVLSRGTVTFATGAGQTLPGTQTVDITNGGQLPLAGLSTTTTYNPSNAGAWLTVNLSGSTPPATLTIQPNTAGLAPGVYTATIHVASTTAGVDPKDIQVTYFVNDLDISLSTVQFTTQGIALPTAVVVTVKNAGGGNITGVTVGPVSYTGRADATYKWLNPVLGSATVSPTGTSLTLNVTRSDSLGDFSAQFTISGTGVSAKTVTVNFTRKATLADALPILQSSTCIGCHTNGNAAFGVNFFNLDLAFSSLAQPKYVTPFDSSRANNYLIQMIDGVGVPAGLGNMPFSCSNQNSNCLPADARMRIYLWILHGAVKGP